jgi:gliding motility-associated-like protein
MPLTLLLMALVMPTTSNATHVMGSDIRWKCLGNDSFEITVTVYRDCNGIQLGSTAPQVMPVGCSNTPPTVITSVSAPVDVTPNKGSCVPCTRCDPGCPTTTNPYGIQKREYKAIIYLGNKTCCNWRISWTECCRNSNITTGLKDAGFWVEAFMNKCVTPCDNSPYFAEDPMAIICVGECFTYNMGATDVDGDSLVYSFTPPLVGAGSPGNYTPPYTFDKPLYYDMFPAKPNFNWITCKGILLDPITGDIAFKPMIEQITVIAIKVESWRNGVKISEIRRDMQIIIRNCPPNDPPKLSGFGGWTSPFQAEICAGETICLDIYTNDTSTNPPDTVKLSWNGNKTMPPGATFTSSYANDPRLPTGTFCWTPTDADARDQFWQFNVTANDGRCPIPASTTRSYRIKVKKRPSATHSIANLGCGKYEFSTTTNPVTSTVVWEVTTPQQNLIKHVKTWQHQFASGGKMPVFLTAMFNGCKREYHDTLNVPNFTRVNLGKDSAVCEGIPFTLTPSILWGQAVSYQWSTGDTVKNINVNLVNDSSFKLTIIDTLGCENSDSIKIAVNKYPRISLGPDQRICDYSTIPLTPMVTYIGKDSLDPVKTWYWYKAGNPIPINNTQTFVTGDAGTYVVRGLDSMGCESSDTIEVIVNESPKINPPDTAVCKGDTATLTALWNTTSSYAWLVDGTSSPILSNTPVLKIAPTATTTYRLIVKETVGGLECENTETAKVTVKDLPIMSVPPSLSPLCIYENSIFLNSQNGVNPNSGGTWSGNGVVGTAQFNPGNAGAGSHGLIFKYTHPVTGCKDQRNTSITVNDVPQLSARGFDTCSHVGAFNINLSAYPTSNGTPVNFGAWSGNGITGSYPGPYFFSPQNVVPGSHALKYTFINQATSCSNSVNIIATVNQTPTVYAGQDIEICRDAAPYQFYPTPAGGTWTSTNGGMPYMQQNGLFTPSQAGNYTYIYCYETPAKCSSCDTVVVQVNELPFMTLQSDTSVCETGFSFVPQSNVPASFGGYGVWSGKGVSANTFNPSVAGGGNGSDKHTLTYRHTSNKGCESSKSIDVTVYKAPTVQITTGGPLCIGTPYKLEASFTGATGIVWSSVTASPFYNGFNNPTGAITIYTPDTNENSAEKFTVRVKTTGHHHNCPADSVDQVVGMHPSPVPDFTADNVEDCTPFIVRFTDQTTIAAGSIFKYNWTFGNGSTSTDKNPATTYDKTGVYTVKLEVESAEGCKAEIIKPQYIKALLVPNAAFEPVPGLTTIALPTIKFENLSTSIKNPVYTWNFDDFTVPGGGTSNDIHPQYTYQDTGYFDVTLFVMNDNGCTDSTMRRVIIDPDITIFVPNAFGPGKPGPAPNRVFKPQVIGVSQYHLQIFNRWGELLYETEDYTESWDGTYRGVIQPEGVYVYLIRARSFNMKKYKYSGTITLLR